MKKISVIIGGMVVAGLIGCAGIEPPSPDKILTHPFGTGPLRVGMTKDEVRKIWGEPDVVKSLREGAGINNAQQEEWIYNARVSNLPINYGYLSKSLRLSFDGDNLTSYKEE